MLEVFDNLEPKIYDRSDSEQKDQIGFIAQEVEAAGKMGPMFTHRTERGAADAELPAHGGGFVGGVQGPTEAGGEIGAEAGRGTRTNCSQGTSSAAAALRCAVLGAAGRQRRDRREMGSLLQPATFACKEGGAIVRIA